MSKPKRPILVTGAHRSGSTWIGLMIARAPGVTYIHEPFNVLPQSGRCGGRFKYWFTYICDDNTAAYGDQLRRCVHFQYPLVEKLRETCSPKRALRALADWIHCAAQRATEKRPLVKGSIAVFSAQWLARTFDMDVIMMVSHPAAFAGSHKQAGWPYPFDHFLKQPLLMRDHLAAYAGQIMTFAAADRDLVDQVILLYNMIYETVRAF